MSTATLARSATTLRTVPVELVSAPAFMVCHGTDAFELFKVEARDAIEAKRFLVEDGHIARAAAVVSVAEVKNAYACRLPLQDAEEQIIGHRPTLAEFDNAEQWNRALAYDDRMNACVARIYRMCDKRTV